jgi:hypothetical protein
MSLIFLLSVGAVYLVGCIAFAVFVTMSRCNKVDTYDNAIQCDMGLITNFRKGN